MRNNLIGLISATAVICSGCTLGKLSVPAVSYQSLRTEYAQSKSIPKEASIAVEFFFNSDGCIQPIVYNLTSEILIVDQTKSFLIMPNGISISYYDPTIRTSTNGTYNSTTDGSSFNLGGLASALGLGGPIGALASATTLSSSQTEGIIRQNTVSITDQPLVNIGPRGSIAMSKAFSIAGIGKGAQSSRNIIDIQQNESDLRFSVCICYSLDEGNSYNKLVTNFYENTHITVPVDNKKVSKAFYRIYELKPDALAESMYMFTIHNNIPPVTTNAVVDFLPNSNIYDTYIYGSLIDFQ